jgi:hypothetical protein
MYTVVALKKGFRCSRMMELITHGQATWADKNLVWAWLGLVG